MILTVLVIAHQCYKYVSMMNLLVFVLGQAIGMDRDSVNVCSNNKSGTHISASPGDYKVTPSSMKRAP